MSSSRYAPVAMTFDEVSNFKEFETYLQYYYKNDANKYSLLKNERFINLLFNSDPNLFREFARRNFSDHNIPTLLFSIENRTIIKSLDKQELGKHLNYIMNLDTCYDIFMQEHNYYLLENPLYLDEYAFTRPLLQLSYKNNPTFTNEFIRKHPEFVIDSNLYKEMQVSTPITSDEFGTIKAIKEYMKFDSDSRFYSRFSIEVINSLIESGYYSLLSVKDKREIIETYLVYPKNNALLSNKYLNNKDFVKYILKVVNKDSVTSVKVLNHIQNNYPHMYESYKTLFRLSISQKENKNLDDIAFLYFNDYLDNIKNNINVIKEYAKSNEEYKKKLNSKTLEILLNLDLDSLIKPDDIVAMKEYLDKSGVEYEKTIYEYMTLARDTFSQDLKENLLKIDDTTKKSISDGVTIHHYEGEPLSFIVHCSSLKRGDASDFAMDVFYSLSEERKTKHYISSSYINKNNIRVFSPESIIYGFNKLKDMKMVSANYGDSFTVNNSDNPITNPSTYLNLDEFSRHSSYTELVFAPTKMKPDFIVCFDEYDDYDLQVAKKLGIDIVCINSNAYKRPEDLIIDEKPKSYI